MPAANGMINRFSNNLSQTLLNNFDKQITNAGIAAGDDGRNDDKELLEQFRKQYFKPEQKKQIKITNKHNKKGHQETQIVPYLAKSTSNNIVKRTIGKIDGVIAEGKIIVGRFEKEYPISYKITGSGIIIAGGATEGLYGAFFPFMYGAGKIIDYTCREAFDKGLDRYVINPVLRLADIRPSDVEYPTAKTILKGGLTTSLGSIYAAKTLKWQSNLLPTINTSVKKILFGQKDQIVLHLKMP